MFNIIFLPESLLNRNTELLIQCISTACYCQCWDYFCLQHLADLDLECLYVFHKCSSFILKMTHVDATIL